MKIPLLLIGICTLVWSCKKQPPYNPDEHITYTHWYEMRSIDSLDTLFSVYIPNAFTPNEDGRNDYFRPHGYFNLKKFQIVNKNNNVVYQTSTNGYFGWDGRLAGGFVLPTGTYVYKLNVVDSVNREYEYTGSVSLYR